MHADGLRDHLSGQLGVVFESLDGTIKRLVKPPTAIYETGERGEHKIVEDGSGHAFHATILESSPGVYAAHAWTIEDGEKIACTWACTDGADLAWRGALAHLLVELDRRRFQREHDLLTQPCNQPACPLYGGSRFPPTKEE